MSCLVTSAVSMLQAQTAGDYRSKQTGAWNDASTWQIFNGITWVDATATYPTSANGIITIQPGHTITSVSNATVDQLIVNSGGTLNITGAIFTVADGTGTDLNCMGTLSLSIGTINGAGSIIIQAGADFNWLSGFIGGSGVLTLSSDAIFTMSENSGRFVMDTRVINNYGTWNWTGGYLYYYNSSPAINNYGTFNISTDNDIDRWNSNTGKFANRQGGTIIKSGAADEETYFDYISSFTNAGTIQINSGTLRINTNFTDSGLISIATGGNISLSGYTTNFDTGSTFSGTGNIIIDGATVNVNVSVTCANSINLADGFLTGSFGFTINAGGAFNWTGGTIKGSGTITVNAGAAFNMSGNDHYLADTKTINNYGNGTWTAGNLLFSSGTTYFNNYGNLDVSTGVSITTSGTNFGSFNLRSPGTISINSGILTLNIGGVHTGNYTIASGAQMTGSISMSFAGASFTNNGTVSLTGLTFNGSTAQTLNGTGNISKLTINNASGVTLGGTQSITANLTLTNGKILLGNNDLLLVSPGTLTGGSATTYIATTGTGSFRQRVTNNNVTVTFPVGHSTSYMPVFITLPGGSTSDDFKVKVLPSLYASYDASNNPAGAVIGSNSVKATWIISESVAGNSAATVKVQWNASDEGQGFTRASSRFGQYTGTTWTLGSSTAAAGTNPYTLTNPAPNISTFVPIGVMNQLVSCTNAYNPHCAGSAISVPYVAIPNFNGGNIFTAQLSDASGDFPGSPTVLGTLSSTTSGTINGSIPSGLTPSTNFRIRVISSSPSLTSSDNGSNISIGISTKYFLDSDHDGFGKKNTNQTTCNGAPTNYVTDSTDCKDNNTAIHPGATEICNGVDDNCVGGIDDGVKLTFYADTDHDGFGNSGSTTLACTAPADYVSNSTDCNDGNASIHPGAADVCNNIDDNCNGSMDEPALIYNYTTTTSGAPLSVSANATGTNLVRVNSATSITSCATGFSSKSFATSSSYNTSLPAVEFSITPNSNYLVRAFSLSADLRRSSTGPASVRFAYSRDGGTSWIDQAADQSPVDAVCGFTITANWDFDDFLITQQLKFRVYGFNASSSSGELQLLSLNLIGMVCPVVDFDGDTYNNVVDCNDNDATIHPNATETCNGIDDDCDNQTDEGVKTTFYADSDNDGFGTLNVTTLACTAPFGFVASSTDCNDANPTVNPNATETCNSIDDDCDGTKDEPGIVYNYTDNTSGIPLSFSANITSGNLVRVNAAGISTACTSGFSSKSFPITTTFSNTLPAIEFTITPATGYQVEATSFSADLRRNSSGPKSVRYAYSIDGGNNWIDQGSNHSPNNSATCGSTTTATWNFNVLTIQSLKFRIYGFNASGTGGVLQLLNVKLTGRICADADNDGYYASSDCDDNNASVNPVATEVCNYIDDNCNNQVDEGVALTFYADADGDGFGNPNASIQRCSGLNEYVSNNNDCDDENAIVHPQVLEICNGIDDNCDGVIDNTKIIPDIQWEKSLGGINSEVANSIEQTSDGGYIIAGGTFSSDGDVTGYHGALDYWIVKSDANGNIVWQKSLGGSAQDIAYSAEQTSDGGYIIGGESYSNDGDVSGNHGQNDYWIIKLNASGNIMWQKSLGGSAYEFPVSTRQTSDGGYIVAGYSSSNDFDVSGNHGLTDYWIVKLDANGNIAWQKSLGGSGSDGAYSIQETFDNGFIIAGYSNSTNGDVSGNNGNIDYWIVKLDFTGNIVWEKSLGGTGIETIGLSSTSIIQTNDGGFIVAGTADTNNGDVSGNHGAQDYWIVKLDFTGNIVWQKCFGGSADDVAYSVQETFEGGFIVIGTSNSIDGNVSEYHGSGDYWIVKLDEFGSLSWQKSFGGSAYDNGTSVRETLDKGFILAGHALSNDGDVSGNHGAYDFWIVKLSTNVPLQTFYGDADDDGFGNINVTIQACAAPIGYVADSTDCDDSNASIYPNATEICNNIDDNCDGNPDEPILIYNYTDNASGIPLSFAVNTTGSNLTRVNGAGTSTACATGFSSKSFTSTTTFSNTLPAIEFTITPASGYQLEATSFAADLRRNGSGPKSVRYAYSLDGGTIWIDQGSNHSPNNSSTCGASITASWDFNDFSTSQPLKFRIYGFNASGTAGVLQLLNVNLSGRVCPVSGPIDEDLDGFDSSIDCEDNNAAINPAALPTKLFDFRYGGSNQDQLGTLIRTSDGGYILGGRSKSPIGFEKSEPNRDINNITYDLWLLKTDAAGTKQWDKTIGGSGEEASGKILALADGSFLVGGYSSSLPSGDKTASNKGETDFWVVKINSSGEIIWDKSFGGSGEDQLQTLQPTADGGFLLAGISNSGVSGDQTQAPFDLFDYWIVKINAAGDYVWDKRFGGYEDDILTELRRTSDGGYLLGGRSFSDDDGNKTQPNYDASLQTADYWVVKIDANGSYQWDKHYGGTDDDFLYAIRQQSNGNYFLGGNSKSSAIGGDKTMTPVGKKDFWVVNTDNAGNKIWDAQYGGTEDDEAYMLELLPDGGYVMAGQSLSDDDGDKSQASQGSRDYWMIKASNTGAKQWDQRYGGLNADVATGMQLTTDGGYILGGYSQSDSTGDKTQDNHDESLATRDYWIVKLNGNTGYQAFYVDADNDSYGDATSFILACTAPEGFVSNSTDCNDASFAVNPGVIEICNSIDDNCNSEVDENTVTATITPQGNLNICTTGSVLLQANTGTGLSYKWKKDGSNISGATNSGFTATEVGVYKVTVTVPGGCKETSSGVTVTKPCKDGRINETFNTQLSVYPNPTDGKFNIELTTNESENESTIILLMNALGQVIYHREAIVKGGLLKEEISLDPSISDGIYTVKVMVKDKMYISQIVYQ